MYFYTTKRTLAGKTSGGFDEEKHLVIFDWFTVLDTNFHNLPCAVGLDLVHQLHRFNDAQHRSLFDILSYFNVIGRVGSRSAVKGADDRRFYFMVFFFCNRSGCSLPLCGWTRVQRAGSCCGIIAGAI